MDGIGDLGEAAASRATRERPTNIGHSTLLVPHRGKRRDDRSHFGKAGFQSRELPSTAGAALQTDTTNESLECSVRGEID